MASISRPTIPMGDPPKSVDEAVERLISRLPLKDRVAIAKMDESELPLLHGIFTTQIREEYGFVRGNDPLMASIRRVSRNDKFDMSKGPALIIDLMWARLRRTHAMRPVK
jgi:hypothetical protein